jgi:hypothetical protein
MHHDYRHCIHAAIERRGGFCCAILLHASISVNFIEYGLFSNKEKFVMR